jgi:hypothetical protein
LVGLLRKTPILALALPIQPQTPAFGQFFPSIGCGTIQAEHKYLITIQHVIAILASLIY